MNSTLDGYGLDDIQQIRKNQQVLNGTIIKMLPVIVYQMGKVASSTIIKTLHESGHHNLFQPHRILAENIAKYELKADKNGMYSIRVDEEGRLVDKYNLLKHAKIITLTREPIERNFSAFFENYRMMTGNAFEDSSHSTKEMIEMFLKNYPHDTPLEWFDEEFNKTMEIDIYDFPFNRERGYSIIDLEGSSVLIMQSEVDDATKEEALRLFLKNDKISIAHANKSSNKAYNEAYRSFKKKIVLPQDYIEKMYNAKYTKHFYSESEIEKFKQRWGSGSRVE
jgi:hypothetical protein